jgi:hypothetical protein
MKKKHLESKPEKRTAKAVEAAHEEIRGETNNYRQTMITTFLRPHHRHSHAHAHGCVDLCVLYRCTLSRVGGSTNESKKKPNSKKQKVGTPHGMLLLPPFGRRKKNNTPAKRRRTVHVSLCVRVGVCVCV